MSAVTEEKMAKKLTFKTQMIITCAVSALFLLSDLVLGIIGIIPLVPFVISLAFLVIISATAIIYLIVKRKKELKAQMLAKKQKEEQRIALLKQLYELIGIEIQYNEDGSIKDIFQLLNLQPIYDENGKRILTIYELLNILPNFDRNGVEKPNVFVIKNRVLKFAKGISEPLVLTYKTKAMKDISPKPSPEAGKKTAKPKVAVKKNVEPKVPKIKVSYAKSKGDKKKDGSKKGGKKPAKTKSPAELIGKAFKAEKIVHKTAESSVPAKTSEPSFDEVHAPSYAPERTPGSSAGDAEREFKEANIDQDALGILEK